ncbi:MAG: hypothetical protein IJE02_04970 [Clostridia bacterium]|nr:hypothetical protein [Clostridia bacterium]
MKKYLLLILALVLSLALVACQKEDKVSENPVATSTVATPYEVRFYKNGIQTVSTDEEFNFKIAQHIEAAFVRSDSYINEIDLAVTTDLIDKMRKNETAIELRFDTAVKFNDEYVISSDACMLFIPVTGEYANFLFDNNMSPDYWGGPRYGDFEIEKFFEQVTFTPLTEE